MLGDDRWLGLSCHCVSVQDLSQDAAICLIEFEGRSKINRFGPAAARTSKKKLKFGLKFSRSIAPLENIKRVRLRPEISTEREGSELCLIHFKLT